MMKLWKTLGRSFQSHRLSLVIMGGLGFVGRSSGFAERERERADPRCACWKRQEDEVQRVGWQRRGNRIEFIRRSLVR